jgi:hypothetical protein
MKCRRCDAEWSVPVAERPGSAVHCPYCEAHVCGCGCGADLSEKRTDAIYEAESHYKRLKRAANTAIPQTRTVADARALHEDAKAHWSMVVDEAIVRHFKADPTGIFHADDLEAIGIPDDHRNVIGSQIAKWVNRKRMVECGRRASTVPSRNGAKSNEYRLTERGARLVAGLDSDTDGDRDGGLVGSCAAEGSVALPSAPPVAVQSGESGVGQGQGKRDRGRHGLSSSPADAASPDPGPRSSTEERRTPKAGRPGSNPGGGTPDHLFDDEAVHLSKQSAFSPENEYA